MTNELDDFLGEPTDVPSAHLSALEKKISKAFRRSQTRKQLQLMHILSARAQTVGGVLYTITALVSVNGQEMKSVIKFLEKLWDRSEKWVINCHDDRQRFSLKMETRRKTNVKTRKGCALNSADEQEENAKLCEKVVETLRQLAKQSKVFFGFAGIESADKKLVSTGCKFDIRAELIRSNLDRVSCQLEFHEDSSGKFRDVQIKCEDDVYKLTD